MSTSVFDQPAAGQANNFQPNIMVAHDNCQSSGLTITPRNVTPQVVSGESSDRTAELFQGNHLTVLLKRVLLVPQMEE